MPKNKIDFKGSNGPVVDSKPKIGPIALGKIKCLRWDVGASKGLF